MRFRSCWWRARDRVTGELITSLCYLPTGYLAHSTGQETEAGSERVKEDTWWVCASSNAIYVLLPMKRRLARIRSRNWSDQSVRSLFYGIFILDTRERNLFVWDSTTRNPVPFNIISKSDNFVLFLFFILFYQHYLVSRENRCLL